MHIHEVSIIVTTRNEEANIRNCLESIRKQDFPLNKIETIVVDNNSSDSTPSIAKEYTDKVYTTGPERSCQRNFGVKQSCGKYILYLDADMILSQGVVKECFDTCENSQAIALYIPERITGKGFWIKVRDFERSFYNGTCIDCVRFIRKDKFLEVGGFDENLTGPEDWDFDKRIKAAGPTAIINAPIYHNEGELKLKKYFDKKSYYVQSFDKYIQKWGRDDLLIKKQLGFGYRYFGVFTENGKWKKLFGNSFLAIGMYFLRVLVGVAYLLRK